MTFASIVPALARALAGRGYEQPTPVQAAVLQDAAAGRDLLVSAQTGSGKTVAYGLAVAPDLLGLAPGLAGTSPDAEPTLPRAGAPLALVVAPTRELAMQVHAELAWLYAEAGGRVLACVGGMDPRREQRLLAAGAHIVVGTPGRLRDHINRRQLDASALRVVVLDEADEMLDLGFREELEFILDAAPPERRTLLFSATIPREIASLARRFQRDALRIEAGERRTPHDDIAYAALLVAGGETVPAVINVLRYHDARIAIVFCPTREAVRALWTALTARGFGAVALSGEMGQADRNAALLALRAGRARVCVATDVAARGLDLPELSLVIHAELPMSPQLLLHRSGRTGRAGRKGRSVLLVTPTRRRRAEAMLAQAGVHAEWGPVPAAEAIRERDDARLLSDPVLSEPPDAAERDAAAALIAGHGAEALAVALLRLHRASLPEEAEVTELSAGRFPARAPSGSMRGAAGRAGPERPGSHAGVPGGANGGGEHAGLANPVWLSASVGRRDKADPKWLLPLLCRMGQVTREQIGLIRILPGETRFEVAGACAERFLDAAHAAATQDVRIARSHAPSAPQRPFGGRPEGAARRPVEA